MTLQEVETDLTRSLTTIVSHWDAMLAPAPSGSIARGSSGSATLADDHADTDADTDRLHRLVSLRREVVECLNGWSRVVMEDRPVEVALPDGTSAPSMCEFLARHAQWFAGHEAAEIACGELRAWAHRVKAVINPHRKEWVYLGDCPFVVDDWFCCGQVRSRIGGDGSAVCSDCGQESEIAWWEEVLGIGFAPVTLPNLVPILRDRLHVTITERTLRNWKRDGHITPYAEPFGPRPLWDRYDPQAVLDQVARMGRQCASCGQSWHGYSDVCNRCYTTLPQQPERAKARLHTPAPISLRALRIVPDSTETDRPERCHWSDLPVDQCACGRTHEQAS